MYVSPVSYFLSTIKLSMWKLNDLRTSPIAYP